VRRYRYSKWRWRVLVRVLDAAGGLAARAWRGVSPPAPNRPPRRILVVQLDHLGDAVLSGPIFARLRKSFPEARIDVLASASNQAFFGADPSIDRVHVAERNWFERRPGARAIISAAWQLGRRLRSERYDLGIDVRGDVLSVLVLALAGIPRRVGWRMGGGGFLLTDVAEWDPGRHEVLSRMALLESLGLAGDPPDRLQSHVRDRDRARVARMLREAWPDRLPARAPSRRIAVGVGPGPHPRRQPPPLPDPPDEGDHLHAGRFGAEAPLLAVHLGAGTSAKRWPLRHWERLVARFLADGWRAVIVGGPEDAAAGLTLPPHPSLRDWTGRMAVTETAALLERADLFLGPDSAPAHLASCAGVTSVVLFSGTNRIAQWRPWSRRALVLRHKVGCRPCHHKSCPLVDHPCMSGLDPDRVYRAAQRWLARMNGKESPHAPL
jgi:heptosyltransferase-2